MVLERLNADLTISKMSSVDTIDLKGDIYFVGKTDEEISLVCKTEDTPTNTIEREDGWKGFRIKGTLDFSLVGVLSKISGILADNKIGIFVVSTYNTDYVLVKKERNVEFKISHYDIFLLEVILHADIFARRDLLIRCSVLW